MYQKPDMPLSIGGVLDDGFSLLKASFSSVLGLAFVAAYISNLPNMVADPQTETVDPADMAFAVLYLFLLPLSLILFGAMIARINAISSGLEMSLGESLRVGLRRFFPLLFCWILFIVAIMLGFVALVIPGLILSVSLLFAPYLVITDTVGPIDSIKRSHKLVWGHWWRTAALFAVVFFIVAAAYILIGILGAMTALAEGGNSPWVMWVAVPLISALITPVMYVFSIAILNDLKFRKEGEDLVDRIEAIADE